MKPLLWIELSFNIEIFISKNIKYFLGVLLATNKLVVGMLLIIISIAAIMFFISLSWKVQSPKCWENLNGSKKEILSSLKTCAKNCWSKHDFGKDITTDDCYTITVFSQDKDIEKNDIEGLDENIKSYLDTLYVKKPYTIKLRYNYTGKEISFVNLGYCGNNILEGAEFCDGNDDFCQNEKIYGECTGDSFCFECKCSSWLDCQKCSNLAPTATNLNTNNDWCLYCKSSFEDNCNDNIDNDCDGKIDELDEDCSKTIIQPPPQSYNFILPLEKYTRYTSCFGWRNQYFHSGIDFSVTSGNKVFAAASGVVERAEYYDGYGNAIIIRHNLNGETFYTLYGHLKCEGFLVKPGDVVQQGQLIGYSGGNDDCKGTSTGAHLHFEIRKNGNLISSSVNPCLYISCEEPCKSTIDCQYYKQYPKGEGCDDPLT